MKKTYLIADSGATKCQWTLVQNGKRQTIKTTGISPYFLSLTDIIQLLEKTFQKKKIKKPAIKLSQETDSYTVSLCSY
jgi:hypothetical protein